MTLKDALREGVKAELAPMLRGHGFRGTLPAWRLRNDTGDVAVVHLQSWVYNSADEIRWTLNLDVGRVEFLREQAARFGSDPAKPSAYDGELHARLHPAGTDWRDGEWWTATTEHEVRVALADGVAQLGDVGVPTLRQMLEPGQVAATVARLGARSGDPVSAWVAY